MNKRLRKKRRKRREAAFIRRQLRHPFMAHAMVVRPIGCWRDGLGVVHVVNALTTTHGDVVDLGRETACGSLFWNPDEPRLYPSPARIEASCMACVVSGGP